MFGYGLNFFTFGFIIHFIQKLNLKMAQIKQSAFENLKSVFKTETGIDAAKDMALFIQYVQAKSLINFALTAENISVAVQRIEQKMKY